ncbi:uncharacterized protein BX664DRAFT_361084 [Halteromyces radiatus]|uniref:uncharacterized protein n=1 Tax=Halteromyces radiatus TaxID=101107 RepID=UPI00221EF405|nr:uncharacterized protein BX664DRAFT_361084 [Halteromyces radiatus]KAI8082787.1 hypothetical protein BX664DRAFT_361084 [Halteromyces radiatus]
METGKEDLQQITKESEIQESNSNKRSNESIHTVDSTTKKQRSSPLNTTSYQPELDSIDNQPSTITNTQLSETTTSTYTDTSIECNSIRSGQDASILNTTPGNNNASINGTTSTKEPNINESTEIIEAKEQVSSVVADSVEQEEVTKQMETTGTIQTTHSQITTLATDGVELGAAVSLTKPIQNMASITSTGQSSESATTTLKLPPLKPQNDTESLRDPRFVIIDRSSVVRSPFSDKFFITRDAFETYSSDRFTAIVDSILKKNAHTIGSSGLSKIDTASHPQQKVQHASSPTLISSSSSVKSIPDNGSTASNGNILDSLLASISKGDRGTKKIIPPVAMPDLQTAMLAAEHGRKP